MKFPYDLIVFAAAVCAVALLLFFILRRLRSAESRGRRGERKIARILRKNMLPGDRLINDLYLADPSDKTRSTQIDHILLSVRGIFVVETKNLSGKIYGGGDRQSWTQVLANGNVRNEFYNPVRQNAAHISVLKKILKTDLKMDNLVVFVRGNVVSADGEPVYSPQTLSSFLHSVKKRRRLTSEERDRLYLILKAKKENPEVSKRRHRKNVRRKYRK